MGSTHVSLHYHLIFSTKDRVVSIAEPIRDRGIGGVPLEIGGTADHVHLLVGLKATHTVADVLRAIKGDSSRWVHETLGDSRFSWQEGYGAFTVSRSNLSTIREYIAKQEEHHRKHSFQEEYLEFLRKHEIEFDERYLW